MQPTYPIITEAIGRLFPQPEIHECDRLCCSLLRKAANHDANEERHHLRERSEGLNVTWSVTWLSWALGISGDHDPYGAEAWSVWVSLGPFCLEAYWRRDEASR